MEILCLFWWWKQVNLPVVEDPHLARIILKSSESSLFHKHFLGCVVLISLTYGLSWEVLGKEKLVSLICDVQLLTISWSWNLRNRMRTALFWFGLDVARVRWTLSKVKDLLVSSSSQRGIISCMNSKRGRFPSAPSRRPNNRRFFLRLWFSRSSVFDSRWVMRFMALINSGLFFSRCSSADIVPFSASSIFVVLEATFCFTSNTLFSKVATELAILPRRSSILSSLDPNPPNSERSDFSSDSTAVRSAMLLALASSSCSVNEVSTCLQVKMSQSLTAVAFDVISV